VAVSTHYAHLRCASRPARRRGAIQVPAPATVVDALPAPEVEARPLSWYDELVEAAS